VQVWFLQTHAEFDMVNAFSFGFGARNYSWTNGFHNNSVLAYQNQLTTHVVFRRAALTHCNGGFDETLTDGMEDWDMWLCMLSHNRSGYTMPEHLIWYRTSPATGRWKTWDTPAGRKEFRKRLRSSYPSLYPKTSPIAPTTGDPMGITPFTKRRPPARFASLALNQNEHRPHVIANPLRKWPSSPRMLLLAPWLEIGGADLFNIDLLRRLVERFGWHVSVIAMKTANDAIEGSFIGPWAHRYHQITPDVFVLPTFLEWNGIPQFVSYFLQSRVPDVVLIANCELAYLLLPFMKSIHPDALFMDYVHMVTPSWKNGGYAFYSATYSTLLDRTLASSKGVANWLAEHPAQQGADRLQHLYIGTNTSMFERQDEVRNGMRASLNISDTTAVVLFVGRMHEQKNPLLFVDTIARVLRVSDKVDDYYFQYTSSQGSEQQQDEPSMHAHIRVYMIGDGPLMDAVRDRVQQLGLQKSIVLLGAMAQEETWRYLNIADIFMQPSRYEGLSLALLEAMSMRLFPIASLVGSHDEVLANEQVVGQYAAAVHIEDHDSQPLSKQQLVNNFADALMSALSNLELTRARGRKAREVVQGIFSSSDQADLFVKECYHAAEARHSGVASEHGGTPSEGSIMRELQWGFAMLAAEEMFDNVYRKFLEMKRG